MRGKRNLPVFVGYALASLVVLGYLAVQMGGEFFLQPTYHVRALFTNGAQLVKDDDVTVAGLRVGKIEWLAPAAQGGAEVGIVLHQRYAPVYNDARALVKSKNLLGETYIELNRGTAATGPMPDGAVIPIDHTLTPVEVSKILDTLDASTRDRLVILVNNLGAATAGNGANMNSSASDLRVIATALQRIAAATASSATQLDALITDLRKILQTLAAWHAEFRAMITDWDRLMTALAQREQDLAGTVRENARVMTIFDQALAGTAAPSLHGAIAEAPQALDNADHYLNDANIVFPRLADSSSSISALFYELASVMSGTGPDGRHMWRVYSVQGPGEVSLPCNPYLAPCGAVQAPAPAAGSGR